MQTVKDHEAKKSVTFQLFSPENQSKKKFEVKSVLVTKEVEQKFFWKQERRKREPRNN